MFVQLTYEGWDKRHRLDQKLTLKTENLAEVLHPNALKDKRCRWNRTQLLRLGVEKFNNENR